MKPKTIILLGVFGVAVLAFGGLLFLGAILHFTKGPPIPGETEFDQANNAVSDFSKQDLSGNNEEARTMAGKYNTYLKMFVAISFKNESGTGKVPTNFKIYCQKSGKGVAFLVNVPELRSYRNDVRVELAALCWKSAQQVLLENPDIELGVGLRGHILYGSVQTGFGKGAPVKMTDSSTELFYPFFAPAAPAAVNPSTAPADTTPTPAPVPVPAEPAKPAPAP